MLNDEKETLYINHLLEIMIYYTEKIKMIIKF